MTDNKDIWIKTGYEMVAQTGLGGLKIETLAKKVGISKSSFYHYFADLDVFMEVLLKYHLQQSVIIAEKEQNARNIDPELIDILVEHKTDLLFNRQLRINRDIKLYTDSVQNYNAPTTRFLSALTGGFLFGWGICIWCLQKWVYDLAPEGVRKSVLMGLLAWFCLDSAGSIASGNASNAFFNVIVLLIAVGPLWKPAK